MNKIKSVRYMRDLLPREYSGVGNTSGNNFDSSIWSDRYARAEEIARDLFRL
jgi:hypothetical protein